MLVDIWKRLKTQHIRDNVAQRTKNVKFKIIKIRTICQYIGNFYYSENLNWAAQNLWLSRMRPAGWKHLVCPKRKNACIYLRKNRLSPRICAKVKKYLFLKFTTMVGKLTQWNPMVPKVWVETQTRKWRRVKILAAQRRSKPWFCIFRVTTAYLCLSVEYVL